MHGRDAIRRQSARYARGAGVLFVLLAALLLLERFGWLAAVGGAHVPWQRVALAVAHAVPEALYLAALWWLRRALVELADGRLFAPVVIAALRRVGLLMLGGSALSVLLLPSLSAWLGQPPGHLIAYDVSKVVIGALGLALGIVGQVLQQAAALQSELDEIF